MSGFDQHERARAGRQQDLTADDLLAVIRRAFGPATTLLRADALRTGTVNSTSVLTLAGETRCILRAGPARTAAAAGPSWLPFDTLQREHALTPWLAPVAPLLPRTLAADFTHQLMDRDWVVQTIVPGEPWSEIAEALTVEENRSLWRQLGAITRRIHAVAGRAFGPLPPGPSFPRWSDLLRNDAAGLVADFARFGLSTDSPRALRDVITRDARLLDDAGPPRLIHSDLDQRHVFVRRDEAGRVVITGLIDYEFGRFADPLSESLLLSLPARPDAAAFFATYGPLPDEPAARRRRRIYQAIALGWTAGDQAHQCQDASEAVASFGQAMRDLGQS